MVPCFFIPTFYWRLEIKESDKVIMVVLYSLTTTLIFFNTCLSRSLSFALATVKNCSSQCCTMETNNTAQKNSILPTAHFKMFVSSQDEPRYIVTSRHSASISKYSGRAYRLAFNSMFPKLCCILYFSSPLSPQ